MELLISTVLHLGEDEFYRVNRYETHLSVALINSTDKKLFEAIDKNIRQTDLLQQLDSALLVVFLTHTNYKASFQCIKKIKKVINFTYTMAEYKESSTEFVQKLFLDNSKKVI